MVLDMAAVGKELAIKPGVAKIRSSQLSATGAASALRMILRILEP